MSNGKAVVVLSGGLDSTVCMGIAHTKGRDIYPLSFYYGQRHEVELERAQRIAEFYGLKERHKIFNLQGVFSNSALTDSDKEVPLGRDEFEMSQDIPITYVPGRNIVFLSIALSYAAAIGAEYIYTGVNALDYSGYPDCRPEFIESFRQVIETGTKEGAGGRIQLLTPLIALTKAGIIKLGIKTGAPLYLTHSCYQGTIPACGECDSCKLRIKGFAEAGFVDPIPYQNPVDWFGILNNSGKL